MSIDQIKWGAAYIERYNKEPVYAIRASHHGDIVGPGRVMLLDAISADHYWGFAEDLSEMDFNA